VVCTQRKHCLVLPKRLGSWTCFKKSRSHPTFSASERGHETSRNKFHTEKPQFCSGVCRVQLKCDGTRAETRFRLSAKRTSPFKSEGASVQSTTGSRGVGISGTNAGYTVFRGSVKSTGYPLHSPVSPSLPPPCVTVCHHISTGVCLFVI